MPRIFRPVAYREPAWPVSCVEIRIVLGRFPSIRSRLEVLLCPGSGESLFPQLTIISLVQSMIADETTGSVPFLRRHALAEKNPFASLNYLVTHKAISVVVALE